MEAEARRRETARMAQRDQVGQADEEGACGVRVEEEVEEEAHREGRQHE